MEHSTLRAIARDNRRSARPLHAAASEHTHESEACAGGWHALVLLAGLSPSVRAATSTLLKQAGYVVVCAGSGDAAAAAIRQCKPVLMLLAAALAEVDSCALIDRLRHEGYELPIMVLAERRASRAAVQALRAGADDYVAAAVPGAELVARIGALLRRSYCRNGPDSTRYQFGNVTIDVEARTVTVNGERVALTPREFDLLTVLYESDGRAVSRSDLCRRARGLGDLVPTPRTVDSHMVSLRKKLEPDPARPRHLITVPKRGYRLDR